MKNKKEGKGWGSGRRVDFPKFYEEDVDVLVLNLLFYLFIFFFFLCVYC